MIVPMLRVFLASRQNDRQQLLQQLANLGVVQIEPVDAATALADQTDLAHLEILKRTSGSAFENSAIENTAILDPQALATELTQIETRLHASQETRHHLQAHLHALGPWGKTPLQDLEDLQKSGVSLRIVRGPAKDLAAELIVPLEEDCYALIDGPGTQPATLPLGVEEILRPSKDFATLNQSLAEVEASQAKDHERLGVLAPLAANAVQALENTCALQVAERSALCLDGLFVVKGWIPAKNVELLESKLSDRNVGIFSREPLDDEEPPTLIAHPAWTKPINGLFKILGAAVGYREFDVSAVFMLALPIFAAMLISDWGYSAVLLVGTILAAQKIRRGMGAPFLHLVRVIAIVGIAWGLLANSFFGRGLFPVTLVPIDENVSSTNFLMFLAFTLGTIHLLIAWLWQVWRLFPSLAMLSPFGWALIVVGMYGLIQQLLLSQAQVRLDSIIAVYPHLLIIGAVLAVVFRDPKRPLRGILIGLADLPLSSIGKFGDVMSYVRLMAVGLAGSLLAVRFNEMAAMAGENISIFLQIFILIVGHSLNLALCCIAIFAHGVRLNMLEFSTNLGLTWSGRPFRPLSHRH